MRTKDAAGPYLDTREGTVAATVVVELALLSFVTIIDRTPTTLAGSESSPEGLFVVPEAGLFPAGLNVSVLSYVSVVLYTLVASVVLVFLGRWLGRLAHSNPRDKYYILDRCLVFLFLAIAVFVLLLVDLSIPAGVEINGRSLWATPFTGWIMLVVMWALLVAPVPVYTFPLLPNWIDDVTFGDDTKRELLEDHIASNWRRARILTTLVLTGAIGVALSFVFSRATPNFLFVVAIVGSVTIGPLGVVWFLMRRIREAEKELRPAR